MASNLKLASFSDREILHMLADLAGTEGWVDADDLVNRVGIPTDADDGEELAKALRRSVGSRMAWIKKLSGCVERDEKRPGVWRLTERGKAVIKANLPTELRARLEGLEELRGVDAVSVLARRYMGGSFEAANLMRREWSYGTHPMRRGA